MKQVPRLITELAFKNKTLLVLQRADIKYLQDLCSKSRDELLELESCVEFTVDDIESVLHQYGLRLGIKRSEFSDFTDITKELITEIKKVPREIFEKKLKGFRLKTRLRNSINELGIKTIGELAQISEEKLLEQKNVGKDTLIEIRAILSKFGLVIGSELEIADQSSDDLIFKYNQFASMHDEYSFSDLRPFDIEFLPFFDSEMDEIFSKFYSVSFFEKFLFNNLLKFGEEIGDDRRRLVFKCRILPESLKRPSHKEIGQMFNPVVTRARIEQIEKKVFEQASYYFIPCREYFIGCLKFYITKQIDFFSQFKRFNRLFMPDQFLVLLSKIIDLEDFGVLLDEFKINEMKWTKTKLNNLIHHLCVTISQKMGFIHLDHLKNKIIEIEDLRSLQMDLLINQLFVHKLLITHPSGPQHVVLQPVKKEFGVTNVAIDYPGGLKTEEILMIMAKRFQSLSDASTTRAAHDFIDNENLFLSGKSTYSHIMYLGLSFDEFQMIEDLIYKYLQGKEIVSLMDIKQNIHQLSKFDYYQVRYVARESTKWKFDGKSNKDCLSFDSEAVKRSFNLEHKVLDYINARDTFVTKDELVKNVFKSGCHGHAGLILNWLKDKGEIIQPSSEIYTTYEKVSKMINDLGSIEKVIEEIIFESDKIVSWGYIKENVEARLCLNYSKSFYYSLANRMSVKNKNFMSHRNYFSRDMIPSDFSLRKIISSIGLENTEFEKIASETRKFVYCTDEEIKSAVSNLKAGF